MVDRRLPYHHHNQPEMRCWNRFKERAFTHSRRLGMHQNVHLHLPRWKR